MGPPEGYYEDDEGAQLAEAAAYQLPGQHVPHFPAHSDIELQSLRAGSSSDSGKVRLGGVAAGKLTSARRRLRLTSGRSARTLKTAGTSYSPAHAPTAATPGRLWLPQGAGVLCPPCTDWPKLCIVDVP